MEFQKCWLSYTLILNVSMISLKTFYVFIYLVEHFSDCSFIGHLAFELFSTIFLSLKFTGQN